MSKTIDKLIQKAKTTGFARVNGRKSYWGYQGDLEEKYSVSINGDDVTLRHWGTTTLTINKKLNKVAYVYGESVSDRDSINHMLHKFGVKNHVHYYPSTHAFELHENGTEKLIKRI